MYERMRDRPGIPWDAPRAWFRSDEAHEAWHARQPIHFPRGRNPLKATRTMREETLRRDGYRCLFCGATSPLTTDHIVPVCFGGSNHPNNRRTLCERDNREHFARFYQPYIGQRQEAA